MNGKINWPMSSAPNTYPELGYFYVWVDTDRNLKAMDSDGNVQNLSARYFEDLLDLNLSNLQDGQHLIYNSTSGKWENDFTDLEDLESLVGEIEAELLTLTSDFDSLADDIDNNDVRISQNTSSITINSTNITSNTNNITANSSRLDDVEPAVAQNTLGLSNKIDASEKGVANGLATLNASGLVDAGQLPSFVSNIEEYNSFEDFPQTGESSKIYIAIDSSYSYRWSGSAYVQLTDQTAIWGEVSGSIENQTDLINYISENSSGGGLIPRTLDLSQEQNVVLESGYIYLVTPDEQNNLNNFVTLPSIAEGNRVVVADADFLFDLNPVTVMGDIDGKTGLEMDVAHSYVEFISDDSEYKTIHSFVGKSGREMQVQEPVNVLAYVDEEEEETTLQAEATDGYFEVKNRLKFGGGSIRIGEETGESDNPDGTGNEIAIGYRSCFGNAAKTNGIGIGIQSLYNVSGSANIGIGLNAGNSNSGNYNVSIGNSAGQYRYLSSSNLCLGYASGYNGKGSDNIYIGAWSGGVPTPNSDATSESNMLRIGAKGGTTAEYLDKELIIGNMNPDVDGGQWLLINGELRTKSPNGTTWAIRVDNDGNLSTEEVT